MPTRKPEYVYIAQSGIYFKIGYSLNVERRLLSISQNLPEPLTLRFHWESRYARGIERELHRRFSGKRRRSEWFLLTEEDCMTIEDTYLLAKRGHPAKARKGRRCHQCNYRWFQTGPRKPKRCPNPACGSSLWDQRRQARKGRGRPRSA